MDKDHPPSGANHRGEPRPGAQAIRRALAVLRILAAGRETGLPLNDVVQATGLKVRPQLPLQMLVMP